MLHQRLRHRRRGRLHDRRHRLEARTCLNLARDGLDRIKIGRCQERSESHFLNDLDSLIEGGVTLAEQLLQNWQGDRQEKLKTLIEHCGFFDMVFRPLMKTVKRLSSSSNPRSDNCF